MLPARWAGVKVGGDGVGVKDPTQAPAPRHRYAPEPSGVIPTTPVNALQPEELHALILKCCETPEASPVNKWEVVSAPTVVILPKLSISKLVSSAELSVQTS